jgi:hypothetical protein
VDTGGIFTCYMFHHCRYKIVANFQKFLINFLVFSVIIKTENYEIIFINNKSGNSIRDKVQITINSYQERQNEIRIEIMFFI